MEQGLELMLFGMGSVVIFLSLLVLATLLMSSVVLRFFAEERAAPAATAVANEVPVLAVITAAIHKHRLKHRLRGRRKVD
ncbi:MAG: OadG family protein [Gammaproteobacteria bacterium]|nr:OadG family protein [Gammaproteobacteria bacterium]